MANSWAIHCKQWGSALTDGITTYPLIHPQHLSISTCPSTSLFFFLNIHCPLLCLLSFKGGGIVVVLFLCHCIWGKEVVESQSQKIVRLPPPCLLAWMLPYCRNLWVGGYVKGLRQLVTQLIFGPPNSCIVIVSWALCENSLIYIIYCKESHNDHRKENYRLSEDRLDFIKSISLGFNDLSFSK